MRMINVIASYPWHKRVFSVRKQRIMWPIIFLSAHSHLLTYCTVTITDLFKPLRFFGHQIYASLFQYGIPHLKENPWYPIVITTFGSPHFDMRGWFPRIYAHCPYRSGIWWYNTSFRWCPATWYGILIQPHGWPMSWMYHWWHLLRYL